MPTFAANASLLKSLKEGSQRELAQFKKERVLSDMKTSVLSRMLLRESMAPKETIPGSVSLPDNFKP